MPILTCAIQLGSSQMMAVAAQKEASTGLLSNIQVASEPSRDCISHGRIFDIEKAAAHIRHLVEQLSERVHSTIVSAYVGAGGMSLHSLIQQPTVQIPDYDVLSSDKIDDTHFQLIVGERLIRFSVMSAMKKAGIQLLGFIILPVSISRILTEQEKETGCVLLDLGASTSTVIIYKEKKLKYLAVIPLGGDSVTYDIQSAANCSFEEAERVKQQWSDVSQESDGNSNANTLFADKALPMPQAKVNNIVLCRYEEIAANILNQINRSGLKEQLLAGCIVTGGGSMQQGITSLLRRRLHISHVQTRAYHEPALPNSERNPQLAGILSLLRFCKDAATPQPSGTLIAQNNISQSDLTVTSDTSRDTQEEKRPILDDEQGVEEPPISSIGSFFRNLFSSQK